MTTNTSISVVTRNFQGGATFDSFNQKKCGQGLITPIRKLLDTAPAELERVIVTSCADPGSPFAEEVVDGTTPTLEHVRRAFGNEVEEGSIILHPCTNWGLNAGSGNALNDGLKIATEHSSDKVLLWSPEIDLTGHMLYQMLYAMEDGALELVGYFRNRWYQRIQWMFAQNTCALWNLDLLNSINGFNPACNGDGTTVVTTLEYGDVPLAGMEDIEAYMRACKERGEFVRWGGVGARHPVKWNLALKVPGTPEYDDNQKKIARQALVMDEYAKRIFPDMDPVNVYDAMMASFTCS